MPPAFALSQDQTLQFNSMLTPSSDCSKNSECFKRRFDLLNPTACENCRAGHGQELLPIRLIDRLVSYEIRCSTLTELYSGITRMLSPASTVNWRTWGYHTSAIVIKRQMCDHILTVPTVHLSKIRKKRTIASPDCQISPEMRVLKSGGQ